MRKSTKCVSGYEKGRSQYRFGDFYVLSLFSCQSLAFQAQTRSQKSACLFTEAFMTFPFQSMNVKPIPLHANHTISKRSDQIARFHFQSLNVPTVNRPLQDCHSNCVTFNFISELLNLIHICRCHGQDSRIPYPHFIAGVQLPPWYSPTRPRPF
jgi:hypothetical protein